MCWLESAQLWGSLLGSPEMKFTDKYDLPAHDFKSKLYIVLTVIKEKNSDL